MVCYNLIYLPGGISCTGQEGQSVHSSHEHAEVSKPRRQDYDSSQKKKNWSRFLTWFSLFSIYFLQTLIYSFRF